MSALSEVLNNFRTYHPIEALPNLFHDMPASIVMPIVNEAFGPLSDEVEYMKTYYHLR